VAPLILSSIISLTAREEEGKGKEKEEETQKEEVTHRCLSAASRRAFSMGEERGGKEKRGKGIRGRRELLAAASTLHLEIWRDRDFADGRGERGRGKKKRKRGGRGGIPA